MHTQMSHAVRADVLIVITRPDEARHTAANASEQTKSETPAPQCASILLYCYYERTLAVIAHFGRILDVGLGLYESGSLHSLMLLLCT